MWWRGQNLELVRADRSGSKWHFRVWHDHVDGIYIQRVFFWDDARSETGLVEFKGPDALHVRGLKDVISRLLARAEFRGRYTTPLAFPVEKHYGTYSDVR